MTNPHLIIDIETCPHDIKRAKLLDEEDRKKLINPIDSKIIAIGIRSQGEDTILYSDDEKEMLEDFWTEWKSIRRGNPSIPVIGFNLLKFDIPFIVTRSFVHNVPIASFKLKEFIDLRQKISAYRFGNTRGTLKELASMMGSDVPDIDGSDIMFLYDDGEHKKIKKYLKNDLEMTEALYKRAESLNINKIQRW